MQCRSIFFLAVFILFSFSFTKAQSDTSMNMVLHSHWDSAGSSYNDVWGYTAPDSTEYAILGARFSIHIFDISNPGNINEVYSDTGLPGRTWRDFKTYGNYMYAVADGGSNDGLYIYDLSNLPTSVTKTTDANDFGSSHNIFIDTSTGHLYVAGTNSVSKGLIVYDLNSNPAFPPVVSQVSFDDYGMPAGDGYVHDLYVRNDTVYASHGYDGLWIWDFINITTPVYISDINLGGYNHSGWLSKDGDWFYFAEEIGQGRPIAVVNLTDITDPNIDTTFKNPLLAPAHTDVTPHNPYVTNDRLYISYYEDGVQIYDVSTPDSPYRIAYYDTEPDNTSYNGTNNNWGIYPFFSSGMIIASDIANGLFVMSIEEMALPVEWIDVGGTITGITAANVYWYVGSEVNHDYYRILYSYDGAVWKEAGVVRGNGNNYYSLKFNVPDIARKEGMYIKIREIALDGEIDDSPIKFIPAPTITAPDVRPKIASAGEPLYVYYNGNFESRLYDLNGRHIRTFHKSPILLPPGAGTYILSLHIKNKESQSFKVIRL